MLHEVSIVMQQRPQIEMQKVEAITGFADCDERDVRDSSELFTYGDRQPQWSTDRLWKCCRGTGDGDALRDWRDSGAYCVEPGQSYFSFYDDQCYKRGAEHYDFKHE